jgi:amidase
MQLDEYRTLDAVALSDLLRRGDVSAGEVIDVAREALRRGNGRYNFLSTGTANAIVSTRAEVELDEDGPFAGVPFLMKEGGGLKGHASISACRMAKDLKSSDDGLFAKLARRAGLSILGTTNVPEFCSAGTTEPLIHGPVKNPWNTGRSAGGSSGGSAAAVAVGAVPIAHGSDGGGSIRIPSHCCGVFGLMPTQVCTPIAANGYGFPIEFTRQHVISRTVRDSAAMLDVLARRDFSTPSANRNPESFLARMAATPRRLKIAFTTGNPSGEPVDPECAETIGAVAMCLADLGHAVVEAVPRYDWQPFTQAFIANWYLFIMHAIDVLEAKTGLKASEELIEPTQLEAREVARRLSPFDIAAQLHKIYAAAEDFSSFFLDVDVLLTPTCVTPAIPLGKRRQDGFAKDPVKWTYENVGAFAPHLIIVNASGQPAMSVPTHITRDGLPVGVQVIARHNDEATLLQLAAVLEAEFPWRERLLRLGKDTNPEPDLARA